MEYAARIVDCCLMPTSCQSPMSIIVACGSCPPLGVDARLGKSQTEGRSGGKRADAASRGRGGVRRGAAVDDGGVCRCLRRPSLASHSSSLWPPWMIINNNTTPLCSLLVHTPHDYLLQCMHVTGSTATLPCTCSYQPQYPRGGNAHPTLVALP